jgi:hypothetical protein
MDSAMSVVAWLSEGRAQPKGLETSTVVPDYWPLPRLTREVRAPGRVGLQLMGKYGPMSSGIQLAIYLGIACLYRTE